MTASNDYKSSPCACCTLHTANQKVGHLPPDENLITVNSSILLEGFIFTKLHNKTIAKSLCCLPM